MEEIIECVQSSLSTSGQVHAQPSSYAPSLNGVSHITNHDNSMWEEAEELHDAPEDIFDDSGEGAGIEGDLDMEEE